MIKAIHHSKQIQVLLCSIRNLNLQDIDNRLSGFDILPFDKEHGFQVVEKMRGLAQIHEASVAQIALAWLLTKPVVSSIIVGASKLHQLEDNLKAINVALSAEETAILDEITAPTPVYPQWFINNLVDVKHNEALKPM